MGLEGLEGIDWSGLRDAKGPSADLPQLLQACADGTGGAAKALRERLLDGSSLTEAATAALPFLAQMLDGDASDDLLLLLADIASGGDHLGVVLGAAELSDHARSVLAAREERIAARVDTANAAAVVLAAVAAGGDGAIDHALMTQAGGKKALSRGMALVGLGVAARRAGSPLDPKLLAGGRKGKAQLPALAATAMVASGGELDAADREALVKAMADKTRVVKGLALGGGSLRGVAARAFALATLRSRSTADALQEAASHKLATDAAMTLLYAIFDGPADEPLAQSALTPAQRAFLVELCGVDPRAFTNRGLLDRALERYGLPDWGTQLARFVGETEPGPADDEVEGAPLWLWVRRCLLGYVSQDELVAHMSTLSVEDGIAVAVDLSTAPYALWRRWPHPGILTPDEEAHDEQQLLELIVASAVAASEPSMMRQYADWQLSEEYRNARGCAMIAAALLRSEGSLDARYDPLVGAALPFPGYANHVRECLTSMPTERAEALILGASFRATATKIKGAWLHVDAVPTTAVAERVVAEMIGWGDEGNAPVEHALACLKAMGEVAQPAVDRAIADHASSPAAAHLKRL
jgi:hypothetical protein